MPKNGMDIMVKMVECVLNGEYKIILPEHRALRPEWYTEQGWEKKRLAHIKSTTAPNDIVYYVGAEEGDMCALLALWGAQLVMFEPNDRVMPNIKAIWKANDLNMGDLFYPGFASTITTKGFEVARTIESITGDVIPDHGFKELRDPDNIPQIKLDDVPMVPNMITLDVEGSEWEVLRGAEKTLKKYHPRIYLSLHPEFLHEQYGEWGAELRRWLMDLGYRETLIDYPLHEVHLFYEAL